MNKQTKFFSLFAGAALALGILSCNRSESDPTPIIPTSVFTARVDGKTFYGGGISATLSPTSISIQSTANEGTGKQAKIVLEINKYAGLTAYPIDTNTTATYTDAGTIYRASNGMVSITTSNDVHVAGSFSFEAEDTTATARQITSGVFDVYK